MRDPQGATASDRRVRGVARSLSLIPVDSPGRDEPNTREGVRKTATVSLPEGRHGFLEEVASKD
jgi:hypothetical protein